MREEIADNRDHAALAIQHRRAGRAVIEHEAVMRNFDGDSSPRPWAPSAVFRCDVSMRHRVFNGETRGAISVARGALEAAAFGLAGVHICAAHPLH